MPWPSCFLSHLNNLSCCNCIRCLENTLTPWTWIINAVVCDAFKVVIRPTVKEIPAVDPFLDNVNGAIALTITSAVDIRYMVCFGITSTVRILNAA